MSAKNTNKQAKQELYTATKTRDEALAKYGDTSKAIRGLRAEHSDWTQGQIARFLNIRPQHVNNVLSTPLKSKQQ